MLYFASIAISIYLFILLAVKPNKTIADKLLMIWQLLATLHLGDIYLQVSQDYRYVPVLLGWGALLALVHGPFLYLYILLLTTPAKMNKKTLFHFLPLVALYLLWLPFLLQSPEQKLVLYEQGFTASYFKVLAVITNIVIIISGVIYVIASGILLQQYKKKIKEEFSNTEKISLNWLRYLIVGIAGIWLFVIFYQTPQTIYISASLYICFIGFFGVRQQQIFKPALSAANSMDAKEVNELQNEAISYTKDPVVVAADRDESYLGKTKYEWSSLTDADAEGILVQLNSLMEQEKLYINAELTLNKLAETLQVKDAVLSQVINSRFNKNFYDYINALRVEECIKMIREEKNQNYTLLSIAFDCGFNSKSSFNRNFRKFTGKSPSEFL
jgi:AraC-like DNA-binding protein/uncharacterized membrane protein YuzA (DUF378 family)